MAKPELTPLQANQALLDANGDFLAASASLSVTAECLTDTCKRDGALKKRWIEKPVAPPPSSSLSRPDDLSLAEAMQREERVLRAGIGSLTKSERARELAVLCQQFQRQNFGLVMQITGGGITKHFLEVMEEVENITDRLNNLDVPPEQRLAYESILREDRARLLDWLMKAAQKVDQGALIMAKIQKMAEGGTQGGKGSAKPGFSPQIRVVDAGAPK